MPSSEVQLESVLANLSRHGTLLSQPANDAGDRQVWRFSANDKRYHVHFYPRAAGIIRRLGAGNRALTEFTNLQLLQKAEIPAPRPISVLLGFRIDGAVGDAVILEAVEPVVRLDRLLIDCDLRGERVPHRARLFKQLIKILQQLGVEKLGHDRLDTSCLAVRTDDQRLLLIDAGGMRRDGLKLEHLMRLAHAARHTATRADLVRAWDILSPDIAMPEVNTQAPRLWKSLSRTVLGGRGSGHFARFRCGGWSGVFMHTAPRPVRWSAASRLAISRDDWQHAWPILQKQLEADQLTILKRDAAGDVLRGEVILGGRALDVVVKRPRRKRLSQFLFDLIRPARARRTWVKTWKMLIRDVPCEWPILLMERKSWIGGYALDGVAVFEHLPGGKTLANADLDAMSLSARHRFFESLGRILRRIDDLGFTHADAKSTNWIVYDDPADGPRPILIDLDGLRPYRWSLLGFNRLMRAMRQHAQFTPEDSYYFCHGYAPEARLVRDNADSQDPAVSPADPS